jgi:hypothetical protein
VLSFLCTRRQSEGQRAERRLLRAHVEALCKTLHAHCGVIPLVEWDSSDTPSEVRTATEKVANRNSLRDFGWEIAHAAVSRRPPVSLHTMVPRTAGYAYDVGVGGLSIVQGPFSVASCQTLEL